MESLERRQMLATITVNTAIDEQDFSITDEDISLRDAIVFGNPGDTINFASSLNTATVELKGALGPVAIEESLTIDASMLDSLTIDASGADLTPSQNDFMGISIFNITDPTLGSDTPLVRLDGLTLKGGDSNDFGGAISSEVSLEIANCIITDNHARRGGAIDALLFRNSTITITNSGAEKGTFYFFEKAECPLFQQAIPEPAIAWLASVGLLAFAAFHRTTYRKRI